MSSQGTKNQRQEQAAATRQKLLTSAQHLFAQNGYKGTTVRMINRSVDLADGLLYHYFPGGKKEIFKEVITGNMQEMFQELQEPEKQDVYEKNLEEQALALVGQDVYEKLPLDAALDAAYINFMTVIDEHLEFIRMMVRENGVREFLSEEEVRSIWKNRIPWLPTLLKRKMEAGEVKEMDFEMAALSVNSILMHYVMKRVTDTGHSTLDDKAWRKRLVDYQVSVWSVEKQPENEKEQE